MQKKPTITIDERVYEGLNRIVGRHCISRFIEDLFRPHVFDRESEAAYEELAKDDKRESEASEWAEGTMGDTSDEENTACGL